VGLRVDMVSAMQHRRPAKVFALVIVPPGRDTLFAGKGTDFDDPVSHIRATIAPGKRVERYGREWIVGQTDEIDGVLSGRIGFQGEPGTADIWDDEQQDFLQTAVPSGFTSPFAIHLNRLEALMQPRGSIIKVNSLIGAFEGLLNADGGKWKLRTYREQMSLSDWKKSVSKVTFVKFTIRRPNPHYFDAKNLEDLMTQSESEVIELEAKSKGGLNLDGKFFVETEQHIDRGYGEAEYRGVKPGMSEGEESIYSTRVGAEEQAQQVEVDPDTGEVPQESLRDLFADETGGENGSRDQRPESSPHGEPKGGAQ